MGNDNLAPDNWALTDPWLIRIMNIVARQTHRKIGRRCFVTSGDIQQDLLVSVFQDSSFLAQLKSMRHEDQAKKLAYQFADNARRRHCRKYISKWPRLIQPRRDDY
jgi:hypothetical protein